MKARKRERKLVFELAQLRAAFIIDEKNKPFSYVVHNPDCHRDACWYSAPDARIKKKIRKHRIANKGKA